MRTFAIVCAAAAALSAGSRLAVDSDPIRDAILKLADAIEKKDAAEGKKQLDVLKGARVLDLMDCYKLRTEDGLGVGPKPGVIQPDGIEAKLIALSRKPLPPDPLAQEADALTRMAHVMAALAEATHARTPQKDKGGPKTRKVWQEAATELQAASLQLADAIKAKKPDDVHKAATRSRAACAACHDGWRQLP